MTRVALRKELSDMVSANEMKDSKVSQMNGEKEVLLQALDDCKLELQQLSESIKLREAKYSDDTSQNLEQLRDAKLKLKIAEGSLRMVNKEKECEKQSYITQNNQLASTLKIFQQKLSEAQLDIENTRLEKSVLIVELEETKRLLKQSLGALRCKTGKTYNDSMISVEIDKQSSNDMMTSRQRDKSYTQNLKSNPSQERNITELLDHENNQSMKEKSQIKSETCADKIAIDNQVIFQSDASEMTLSVIECKKPQPTDNEDLSLNTMPLIATWDASSMKHSLTTNLNQDHSQFQTECDKQDEHSICHGNSKWNPDGERSNELSTATQVSNDEISAKFTNGTINHENASNVYEMSDFDPESTVDCRSIKGNESASLNSHGQCMEIDGVRDTKILSDSPMQHSTNSTGKALSSKSSVSIQSSSQLESSSSVGIQVYDSNRNGNQGDWW